MRHSTDKPYLHIFQPLILLVYLPLQSANASSSPSFHLEGYGELLYSHFDFGPDQKSGPHGSPPDSRAIIDITRLALELEVELLKDTELEAEVEFEHGGAGAALELEFEEFGEFEQEIEKGGEAVVANGNHHVPRRRGGNSAGVCAPTRPERPGRARSLFTVAVIAVYKRNDVTS